MRRPAISARANATIFCWPPDKVAPIVAPVHSEQYDCRAMNLRKGIRQDDEAASRLAPKRGYDRFDFGWIAARWYR